MKQKSKLALLDTKEGISAEGMAALYAALKGIPVTPEIIAEAQALIDEDAKKEEAAAVNAK